MESVVSQSRKSLSSTATSRQVNQINGYLIFALFDQVTQRAELPGNFVTLVYIFVCFQVCIVSLSSGKFIDKIAFFTDANTDVLQIGIVFTIIFALIMFSFIFPITYYKSTRRFMNWTLYCFRFCCDIIEPIIIIPMASELGILAKKIIDGDGDAVCFIFIILIFIYFATLCILYTISQILLTSTAFMSRSPVYCTKGMPVIIIIVGNGIILFLMTLVGYMPKWSLIIFCIFHTILMLYPLILLLGLPYFQIYTNNCFLTVCSTLIICNIMFMCGASFEIRLYAFGPVFFVSLISFGAINYMRIKRIRKLLAIPDLNNDSDINNLSEYFTSINTEKYVPIYLHIGLKYLCPLFTNFSILKYLFDRSLTHDDVVECVKASVLFPSQTSYLNVYFQIIDRNVKLPYQHRFLLYQVYRIKLLRQSSSSASASTKFEEMKSMTKILRNKVSSFWSEEKASFYNLADLNRDINMCSTRWEETINDFPNSQMHRDEYVRFLVDVTTDFRNAIKHHYINSMIEDGKSFAIDYCFRSLVNVVPEYLKRNIVDIKGNLIEEIKKKKGSQSTNSKVNSSFNSTSIDAKIEESIGKVLIKQSRMRVALQNTLHNRKSSNIKRLTATIGISLSVSLLLYCIMYGIFCNYFDNRYNAIDRSDNASAYNVYYMLSSLYVFLGWANSTTSPSRLNFSLAMTNVEERENLHSFWNGEPFTESLQTYSTKSMDTYNLFINEIAELSLLDVNIYELANNLLNEVVPMIVCVDNHATEPSLFNLRVAYMNSISAFSLMYSDGIPFDSWWVQNEYWCKGFISLDTVEDSIEGLRETLLNDEYNTAAVKRKLFRQLQIIIPIIFAVVITIPSMIFLILTIKETNYLIDVMGKAHNEFKQEAQKTLLKNEKSIDLVSDSVSVGKSKSVYIHLNLLLICLLKAALIALIVVFLFQCDNLNREFEYINSWILKSSMRVPIIVEITFRAFVGLVIGGSNPVNQLMFDIKNTSERIFERSEKAEKLRSDLVTSNDQIMSILGYDENIDALLFKASCEPNKINSTLHDVYSCGSVHQQISWLENVARDMIEKHDQYDSTLNNDNAINMFHITVAHIIPKLQILDNHLRNLMMSFVTMYDNDIAIIFAVGIILTFVELIMEILFLYQVNGPYRAALLLIRRLPPIGIVNNTRLIDYILNKNSGKSSSEMTTTRAVLHNSNDGIILLSCVGTIEYINLSITKVLGYTPEQMLGQHLNIIFSDEDKEKITNQIQLMTSNQSGTSFDDHFHCISDTEQLIPCNIMIFGMTGTSDEVESFVVVLRDESILVDHQKEAEEAKQQSENLLFQILPRDIVIRLNRGEKDISFVVQSASIGFIDIVKFSEYSSTLSPSEIMGTLSYLFGAFDTLLTKFPLITKIKLIGDVYMCASGLFSPDEPPQHHAEQLVRFGLESLQVVEDTNVNMPANLSVRIGLNSGGPLIAGVLGTDKPVFDIIGDPINIASRLQSTDIPGLIQISQSTHELIASYEFNVEARGEVFLKGKGKTKTFFVKPLDDVLSHHSFF